jgi:hypothetical protein
LVDGSKKEADIEYLFENDVINYTLDGVLKHPVTLKLQASFQTQLLSLWIRASAK